MLGTSSDPSSTADVDRHGGPLALLARVCLMLLAAAVLPQRGAAQNTPAELGARVEAIFAKSCALSGCHAGPVAQMNMNLESHAFVASTVDVPSLERPDLLRVHPGEPDSSYLIMKVRGTPGIVGMQMPFTGDRLTEEEIETLEAWVESARADDIGMAPEPPAAQERYPFLGWKVINLPTTRTIDQGRWLFLISHRFVPTVGTGYESFFGLDGSGVINMSLGYAFTDRFLVALSRSNAANVVELQGRYRLAAQRHGEGWPVGVSAIGSVDWVTSDPAPLEPFKAAGQVSITRQLTDRIGLAVVPGVLLNPNEAADGLGPTVTVGLGGRWSFARRFALVAEWVPIVAGYYRTSTVGLDNRFDTWGGGFEIATAGHVFQIVAGNAAGLTTDQYMRGGDLDIRDFFDGDFRLGFNIFRVLNF